MDGLSGAASVIAVIQLTGSIVEICGGYISKVKNAKQDILHLQQEIRALTGVLVALNELLHGPGGTELTTSRSLFDNVSKCFATLTHIKEKIDPGKDQNSLRRRVFRALKWPLQQSDLLKVISDIERYKSLFSLALQLDQTKTIAVFKQSFNLDSLRIAEGAAFNSYNDQHTECLPGTRTKLLDEVDDWTKSSHGKCIFWLNGMAGTGKSTISRTVAGRLKAKNLLGASFFFKQGEGDRGNARKLFPTLIKQLVTSIPQLMPSIQKAIEDDPDISEKMLREQFEKLILQPLLGTKCGQTSTMVIVIDALDECEQEDDIRLILQLLPQVQKSKSVQLRFLLTSRPYLPLKLGFKGIMNDHQALILHEIPQPVIEHDISLYIKDKFSQLRMERSLPSDWPGDETIKTLVQRAVPLFISAATLYRFISDTRWNPETRLEAILADQTIYVSRMDSTYMPVLNQLLTGQDEWESQQLVQEFKEIVGVIILLAHPLSVNALAQLLKIRISDINNRLSLLQSVLDIPGSLDAPVRLLHLSFRDFLLDPKKKDSSRFWIDGKATHRKIAIQCLELMNDGLKRNICNLPNEGTKRTEVDISSVYQYLPSELQYSCRYWAQHLMQSESPLTELDNAFPFLEKHFLHWVEAMSMLGAVSDAVGIINSLQSIIPDTNSKIATFLHDARRFILRYGQIGHESPLQLYCSGLIFAPKNSVVRQMFIAELPSWICRLPNVEEYWSAELQTLEGHSGRVPSVAFSPDGRLLASGSGDKTIKLWDPATGALQQTLEGHSASVSSVVFSPDGRLLASGSGDKTIKLWDPATGALLQSLIHDGIVTELKFSEDSPYLSTNLGLFNIQPWYSKYTSYLPKANIEEVFIRQNQWITVQGERRLWLPPEYRPTCSTFKMDGTFILGHASGKISFIRVSV